ncbi:MAG TPA: hypothetical protein PKK06_10515 [Phycisphaerae bacterium]|nr:hypothetical protein [Phycisphaerae bacterium]HNU45796.1 hypothetical protein [Phycisphaerae bacterium]
MRIMAALLCMSLTGCVLKSSNVQTTAETQAASLAEPAPTSWPAWAPAPAWYDPDAPPLSADELRARPVVLIETKVLHCPAEVLIPWGLAPGGHVVLNEAAAQELLEAATALPTTTLLTSPRVLAAEGQQARVGVTTDEAGVVLFVEPMTVSDSACRFRQAVRARQPGEPSPVAHALRTWSVDNEMKLAAGNWCVCLPDTKPRATAIVVMTCAHRVHQPDIVP